MEGSMLLKNYRGKAATIAQSQSSCLPLFSSLRQPPASVAYDPVLSLLAVPQVDGEILLISPEFELSIPHRSLQLLEAVESGWDPAAKDEEERGVFSLSHKFLEFIPGTGRLLSISTVIAYKFKGRDFEAEVLQLWDFSSSVPLCGNVLQQGDDACPYPIKVLLLDSKVSSLKRVTLQYGAAFPDLLTTGNSSLSFAQYLKENDLVYPPSPSEAGVPWGHPASDSRWLFYIGDIHGVLYVFDAFSQRLEVISTLLFKGSDENSQRSGDTPLHGAITAICPHPEDPSLLLIGKEGGRITLWSFGKAGRRKQNNFEYEYPHEGEGGYRGNSNSRIESDLPLKTHANPPIHPHTHSTQGTVFASQETANVLKGQTRSGDRYLLLPNSLCWNEDAERFVSILLLNDDLSLNNSSSLYAAVYLRTSKTPLAVVKLPLLYGNEAILYQPNTRRFSAVRDAAVSLLLWKIQMPSTTSQDFEKDVSGNIEGELYVLLKPQEASNAGTRRNLESLLLQSTGKSEAKNLSSADYFESALTGATANPGRLASLGDSRRDTCIGKIQSNGAVYTLWRFTGPSWGEASYVNLDEHGRPSEYDRGNVLCTAAVLVHPSCTVKRDSTNYQKSTSSTEIQSDFQSDCLSRQRERMKLSDFYDLPTSRAAPQNFEGENSSCVVPDIWGLGTPFGAQCDSGNDAKKLFAGLQAMSLKLQSSLTLLLLCVREIGKDHFDKPFIAGLCLDFDQKMWSTLSHSKRSSFPSFGFHKNIEAESAERMRLYAQLPGTHPVLLPPAFILNWQSLGFHGVTSYTVYNRKNNGLLEKLDCLHDETLEGENSHYFFSFSKYSWKVSFDSFIDALFTCRKRRVLEAWMEAFSLENVYRNGYGQPFVEDIAARNYGCDFIKREKENFAVSSFCNDFATTLERSPAYPKQLPSDATNALETFESTSSILNRNAWLSVPDACNSHYPIEASRILVNNPSLQSVGNCNQKTYFPPPPNSWWWRLFPSWFCRTETPFIGDLIRISQCESEFLLTSENGSNEEDLSETANAGSDSGNTQLVVTGHRDGKVKIWLVIFPGASDLQSHRKGHQLVLLHCLDLFNIFNLIGKEERKSSKEVAEIMEPEPTGFIDNCHLPKRAKLPFFNDKCVENLGLKVENLAVRHVELFLEGSLGDFANSPNFLSDASSQESNGSLPDDLRAIGVGFYSGEVVIFVWGGTGMCFQAQGVVKNDEKQVANFSAKVSDNLSNFHNAEKAPHRRVLSQSSPSNDYSGGDFSDFPDGDLLEDGFYPHFFNDTLHKFHKISQLKLYRLPKPDTEPPGNRYLAGSQCVFDAVYNKKPASLKGDDSEGPRIPSNGTAETGGNFKNDTDFSQSYKTSSRYDEDSTGSCKKNPRSVAANSPQKTHACSNASYTLMLLVTDMQGIISLTDLSSLLTLLRVNLNCMNFYGGLICPSFQVKNHLYVNNVLPMNGVFAFSKLPQLSRDIPEENLMAAADGKRQDSPFQGLIRLEEERQDMTVCKAISVLCLSDGSIHYLDLTAGVILRSNSRSYSLFNGMWPSELSGNLHKIRSSVSPSAAEKPIEELVAGGLRQCLMIERLPTLYKQKNANSNVQTMHERAEKQQYNDLTEESSLWPGIKIASVFKRVIQKQFFGTSKNQEDGISPYFSHAKDTSSKIDEAHHSKPTASKSINYLLVSASSVQIISCSAATSWAIHKASILNAAEEEGDPLNSLRPLHSVLDEHAATYLRHPIQAFLCQSLNVNTKHLHTPSTPIIAASLTSYSSANSAISLYINLLFEDSFFMKCLLSYTDTKGYYFSISSVSVFQMPITYSRTLDSYRSLSTIYIGDSSYSLDKLNSNAKSYLSSSSASKNVSLKNLRNVSISDHSRLCEDSMAVISIHCPNSENAFGGNQKSMFHSSPDFQLLKTLPPAQHNAAVILRIEIFLLTATPHHLSHKNSYCFGPWMCLKSKVRKSLLSRYININSYPMSENQILDIQQHIATQITASCRGDEVARQLAKTKKNRNSISKWIYGVVKTRDKEVPMENAPSDSIEPTVSLPNPTKSLQDYLKDMFSLEGRKNSARTIHSSSSESLKTGLREVLHEKGVLFVCHEGLPTSYTTKAASSASLRVSEELSNRYDRKMKAGDAVSSGRQRNKGDLEKSGNTENRVTTRITPSLRFAHDNIKDRYNQRDKDEKRYASQAGNDMVDFCEQERRLFSSGYNTEISRSGNNSLQKNQEKDASRVNRNSSESIAASSNQKTSWKFSPSNSELSKKTSYRKVTGSNDSSFTDVHSKMKQGLMENAEKLQGLASRTSHLNQQSMDFYKLSEQLARKYS